MSAALASVPNANLEWTSETKFLIHFQPQWIENPHPPVHTWPPEETPIQNTINLMDWMAMWLEAHSKCIRGKGWHIH